MSLQVGVIGCGVVGAAVAYELAQVPGLAVTVLDRRAPEHWEATGAALGVLMVGLSQKKGNTLRLRLASLRRYETLIPELEVLTDCKIPFNRQGILWLCFDAAELDRWQKVAAVRSLQELPLEILSPAAIAVAYPEVEDACDLATAQRLVGAVYSPQDRQVDPVALTQALVKAAESQGVTFEFQTTVQGFATIMVDRHRQVQQVHTDRGEFPVDWLVLASGLGSTLLSRELQQPIDVRPVLGQALQFQLRQPLASLRPVVSGVDVHLVPVGLRELWVGATVEFPVDAAREVQANPQQLAAVLHQAIALCPMLAEATVTHTWSGLRPRPQDRPAPIVEPLSGYRNVLLATGHYRNGVLLAPVTAQQIRKMITTRTEH